MMKRLWSLLLCAVLLAGCTGQRGQNETENPETAGVESSAETEAGTETETESESETAQVKNEPETAPETVTHPPVTAREITLDPAAKGYIYMYTYPSPSSPDTTLYYCTDTPIAGGAMDGTQKEKPDGVTFTTDTRLPSALESETAENATPTADDIATLTLLDVISCTTEYPEYAYVSRDSYSDGYLFYHDSTWMAYRLTDGTTLPITHADVENTDSGCLRILTSGGLREKMYPGYVLLYKPVAHENYTEDRFALYDLTKDTVFIDDMANFSLCGDYLSIPEYNKEAQTSFFDLTIGTLAGSVADVFADMECTENGKYYITVREYADGEQPFSVYNTSFERIAASPLNQFATTADGYGIVINEDMTGYRIFDTDGTTISEVTGFDQVIKLYNNCDYVCVAYDGWLQFRKMHDGAFLTNLCPYDADVESSGDGQYYIHTMISGYTSGGKKSDNIIDYADATPDADGKYDYSVSRFAVNTGTAVEPKFTIERYPDTLPSGVYIMVEEPDIPDQIFPDDGTAHTVEYYLTDNGELYRIETGFMGGYAKPVLYLYPEAETELSVSFAHPESLTTVYPAYPANGWHVVAQPDGTLRTVTDGTVSKRTYYALYWEESGAAPCDFSTGFCVAREDSAAFLEDSLAALGFTDREANECILYWLPILEKSPYNLVSFELTESREAYNALRIFPKPDSLLRVALHILPITEPFEIEPQTLPTFIRRGFTAVEWGGTYGG